MHQAQGHFAEAMTRPSAVGNGFVDFFTGGGSYMPRTHCMLTTQGGTDWPWVIALITLTLIIITGYLKIFVFWRRAYLAEEPGDRNDKLMDLAWMFLLCAVCGYVSSIVVFFWPGYRLLALLFVPLCYVTWRFARDLSSFRLALQAKRLERELRESLERRNEELENLVTARTAEAIAARDEAQRANKAKSAFVANMSHEIRTPMNAILGFTELLCEDGVPPATRTEHAGIVRRNSKHLLSLINDILDISKIEAGEMPLEEVACDPMRIARDACDMLKERAAKRGNTITCTSEQGVPTRILTDPFRLRQILVNLVGNATKFTEDGKITVTVSADDDTIRYTVTDTGIGMDKSQIAEIFKPFSQADVSTTRRYGGTGLGLTISTQLATMMGGGIDVTSTPGVGSTFTVAIARRESVTNVTNTGAERATSRRNDREDFSCNVLLAEDGPDTQHLVRYLLERAGASLTIVENGRDAVEALDRDTAEPFDLVLMDIGMPVMNGDEAVAIIRSKGIDVPIIALTAAASTDDRQRALDAGCNAFLTKPVSPDDLINLCQDVVNAASQTPGAAA